MAQRERRYTPLQFLNVGTFGQVLNGSLFDDSSDTFFNGDVRPQNLFGSLHNNFTAGQFTGFGGTVQLESGTIALNGSLFDEGDSLFTGTLVRAAGTQSTTRLGVMGLPGVNLNFAGKDLSPVQDIASEQFLTDADTFFQGTVSPQVTDIDGSLLIDSDTLNHGLITIFIEGGSLIVLELDWDIDILYHGLVSPQNLFGSLLTNTNTLNQGEIDLFLFGALFEDDDSVESGTVSTGLIDISASILEDGDNLFGGTITRGQFIPGSRFVDGDSFFGGLVEPISLNGSLLTNENNLFHGLISPINLFGSILTDADSLFDGDLGSLLIQGSLLSDSDTFNQADIDLQLYNSLLSDSDTLNHGRIAFVIRGPSFSDADTLNHGDVDLIINASFLEDGDTFNQGSFGFGGVTIQGSLLEDDDDLTGGTILIGKQIQGEPIDEANQIFHGRIDPVSLYLDFLDDTDTLNHGIITAENQITFADILTDEDIFYGGTIDKQDLLGGGAFTGDSIKILASTSSTSASLNHTVDLPDGCDVAGRLVIVGIVSDGLPTFTWPAGWTEIFDAGASLVAMSIAYRELDGTEGFSGTNDTITVTTSADEATCSTSYLLGNFNASFISVSSGASGTNAAPNPDTVTPSAGYNGYAFIAFHGHDVGTTTTTAFPSNYGSTLSTQIGGTEGCGIGSGIKIDTASSENPGTFTISQTRNWVAATVSILSIEGSSLDEFFGGSLTIGLINIDGSLFEDSDVINAGHAYFGLHMSSAQRNRTAASVNPPPFTIAESSRWISGTIIIKGT